MITRGGSGYTSATVGFGGGFANTLKITDSIVQAYPQFGIRYLATYPNLGVVLDNVSQEVGNCANPIYPTPPSHSPQYLQSQAGLIALGPIVRNTGRAAGAGNMPIFVPNPAGSNNYVYWIVGHSKGTPALGTTPPLLAGSVSINASSANAHTTVYWPQMCQLSAGNCGTVSYDVIRVPGSISDQLTVPTSLTGGSDGGIVANTPGTARQPGSVRLPTTGVLAVFYDSLPALLERCLSVLARRLYSNRQCRERGLAIRCSFLY